MEEKKREELSLPSYMQRKSNRKPLTPSYVQSQSQARKPGAGQRPQAIKRAPQKSNPAGSGQGGKRPPQGTASIAAKTNPTGPKGTTHPPKAKSTPKPTQPLKTAQGNHKSPPPQKTTASARSASATKAREPMGENRRRKIQPVNGQNLDMAALRAANAARKTNQPARKKRVTAIKPGRLALALLLLIAAVGGIWHFLLQDSGAAVNGPVDAIGETDRIPDGVSVLGIDVGGQTRSSARELIVKTADSLLAGAAITLQLDGTSYEIKGADLGLSYDIEAVLDAAVQYTEPEEEPDVVVDVTNTAPASQPGAFDQIFTWDEAALRRALENIAAQFDVEPVDAIGEPVLHEDHTVSFTHQDGKTGRAVDVDATLAKITETFQRGIYTAQLDGEWNTVQPAVTAAMLSQQIALRGSYTTRYATIGKTSEETPTIENRVFNIQKAAGIINGCMIAPGESWSFNDFVGERSLENGWKEANGIANGKEYVLQAGGGICQVSTTLYNALLQADVTVTNRRAHSIPSDYVDHGLDATVDYAMDLDLEFINDTGAPIYLFAYCESVEGRHREDITFLVYGKPLENGVSYKTRSETIETIPRNNVHYTDDYTIPRGYKVVTIEARPGYVAEVYLDKYVGDGLVSSEYLYTDRYEGNDEEALRGAASPKYYEPPANAVPIDD